jgi:hypothetical protein
MAYKTASMSAWQMDDMKLVDDHVSEFILSLVGRSGYTPEQRRHHFPMLSECENRRWAGDFVPPAHPHLRDSGSRVLLGLVSLNNQPHYISDETDSDRPVHDWRKSKQSPFKVSTKVSMP